MTLPAYGPAWDGYFRDRKERGLMAYITQDDLDNWFTYHAPKEGQHTKNAMLRQKAKELAELIVFCCPDCADTTATMRKLRETVHCAIMAIEDNS